MWLDLHNVALGLVIGGTTSECKDVKQVIFSVHRQFCNALCDQCYDFRDRPISHEKMEDGNVTRVFLGAWLLNNV